MTMKKLLLLTALGLTTLVQAQGDWCSSTEKNQALYHGDNALKHQAHEIISRSAQNIYDGERSSFIIPVVVHVIHDGGEGNISYEQIQDGIDVMNEDFNKENPDTIDIRNNSDAPFAPIAADVGIEFRLARLDPDGNCTNGVQRKYAPHLTNNADDACKYSANGGLDGWPSDMYVNIWVVNSIDNDGGAGITIGYAYLPYFSSGADHGILYRHDYFGRIGTSISDGEALTHEMGHILGLLHPFDAGWGGTTGCHTGDCDANGDYVCDTPPANVAMFGCSPLENTCDEVPAGDPFGFDAFDQYENWMSYNSCQMMFSEDQKNIMLNNLTDIGFLESLVSPSNIDDTGVDDPEELCKAEFEAENTLVCAGNDVQFFDYSYFNVTGWTWTFEGGTPATSSAENPVVSYSTGGTYDVTLEVTDGTTTISTTLTDYITVLGNPGTPSPYIEIFESMTALTVDEQFFVQGSGDTWELTDEAGYSGTHSAWIDNFAEDAGMVHILTSGTIDLSGIDPSEDLDFVFKTAYKKRNSSTDEALRLYVSNDCGETWVVRKIFNDELGEETQGSRFTPESKDDWITHTVTNITSSYYVENFRYRFEFYTDGGNNIYIDDINVYPSALAGIQDGGEDLTMSLYPNPANDIVTLDLGGVPSDDLQIIIFNSVGQTVKVIEEAGLTSKYYQIETTNVTPGVYFLNVNVGNKNEALRLVIE